VKRILTLLFFCAFFSVILGKTPAVYAQRLSSVGIISFEAATNALEQDAANLTMQVVQELSSWGTMIILTGSEAEIAEYVVRSTLSRQGNTFTLSARTIETSTGRTLNETREQAQYISGISIFDFSAKAVENVPFPNYLLGKWQSTINLPDGQVTAVIEFRSNRTVHVEQYETWERRQNNALKYEGYGSGSYRYTGYLRRNVALRDSSGNPRRITADATVGISLNLEEALTEYKTINQGGMLLLFNETKNSFEIVWGGLPCGANYQGTSETPSERLFFTRFNKIQ